ncbi:MAG: hypothetical protein WBK96_06680 [Candidatus Manganitrophaceae bacterium]
MGDTSRKYYKTDAEIVEAILLDVAELTNRYPTVNAARGSYVGIDAVFRDHGMLKINVEGYDPLSAPWSSRPLVEKKVIHLRNSNGTAELKHDWRSRRS